MKTIYTKNQVGFTLIELIMVIVILGILAAVIVPKYFDFIQQSETAVEDGFIGSFKTGLNMYATDKLVSEGIRKFPCAQWAVFDSTLSEVPSNWQYQPAVPPTYYGTLVHTRKDGTTKTWRYFTTGSRSRYAVQDATYFPPPPPQSGPGGIDMVCN